MLLLGACAFPASHQTATVRTLPPEADEIRNLVELINDHRRTKGCKPLVWDDDVAAIARAHSADMVKRNFFSHNNPNGKSPFDRLDDAKIKYSTGAENIAAGQRTGAEVFRSWINSPGHRRNIENCALREHGIGLTRGPHDVPIGAIGNAWTHLFVTQRD